MDGLAELGIPSDEMEHTMLYLQFVEALYGLYMAEDEFEGQGLVEYALIIGFIAIVVIVAMIFFQERLSLIYSKIGNSIPN